MNREPTRVKVTTQVFPALQDEGIRRDQMDKGYYASTIPAFLFSMVQAVPKAQPFPANYKKNLHLPPPTLHKVRLGGFQGLYHRYMHGKSKSWHKVQELSTKKTFNQENFCQGHFCHGK